MQKGKRILIKAIGIICICLASCLSYGQKQRQPHNEDSINYLYADKVPSFPGGNKALKTFIKKNIKWPGEELDIQGTVLLSFIVETSGDISNIRVERSPTSIFDNEAKRVISIMPRWIPGVMNGKKVNVRMYIPIDFTLN